MGGAAPPPGRPYGQAAPKPAPGVTTGPTRAQAAPKPAAPKPPPAPKKDKYDYTGEEYDRAWRFDPAIMERAKLRAEGWASAAPSDPKAIGRAINAIKKKYKDLW